MPHFSHRPAFPDQPDSHAEHRVVVYDGVRVGSATYHLTAHRGHVWSWGAMAADGYSVGGECQSLEEALDLIKEGVLASMERWPDLMEEKRVIQKLARDSFNHWARLNGRREREI